MTKINARALARARCMEVHGEAFNEDIFTSAFEKLKRHVRNKFGSVNWEAEHAENDADGVLYFYKESAEGKAQTWNGAKAAQAVGTGKGKITLKGTRFKTRAQYERAQACLQRRAKQEAKFAAAEAAAAEAAAPIASRKVSTVEDALEVLAADNADQASIDAALALLA
jgi:hypothetical protein